MFFLRRLLCWRVLGLAWLITWITTAPLFHVHIPDTTDRWSAIQSGGAHTVLTADLVGEYSTPIHDRNPDHRAHLSHRVVNSPELGIALFEEKSKKTKELHPLAAPSHFIENPVLPSSIATVPSKKNERHFSKAFSASRAPPHTLCI